MIKKLIDKLHFREKSVIYSNELKNSYSKSSVCGNTLVGKNIVITGGSSGIGLACAQRFLLEGAESIVIIGRNHQKLHEAKTYLKSDKIKILEWDIANTNVAKEKIIEAAELANNCIDVLINNAGVFTKKDQERKFRQVSIDEFNYVVDINLKGTWFCCQATSDYMINHNLNGHIVNISSICATQERYMYTPYGISKYGIINLTKGLSTALMPHGIVVNGIAPGSVATAMGNLKENDNIYNEKNLLKRCILPEEIAALAAFLASPFGNMLAGQVIEASGLERL